MAGGLGQHNRRDELRVVGPGGLDLTVAKTCLSKNDRGDGLLAGDEVVVFEKPRVESENYVSWALLNCFEYTHPEIIGALESLEIELLVVLTANIATRLYREYATADVHRLFSYIVVANIAECGGSGIYGPLRRRGSRAEGRLTVAGEILASRGPGEVVLDTRLSIADLRAAKHAFRHKGFDAIDAVAGLSEPADMMVPSQRYIDTGDGVGCGPVSASIAKPIEIDWHDGPVVTVGVAQLRSADAERYRECAYRLDSSPIAQTLKREVAHWLDHAKSIRSASGRPLDVLVLPEVFVSRSLVGILRDFAVNHRCTVIAGFDYPAKPGPNVNETAVFPRDGSPGQWYRKITRSQYDGQEPKTSGGEGQPRLRMERGDSLLRFVSPTGRSFGVLICYDFSHVALMNQLNLDGRDEPLELVVVVAHNPFGQLYRSGCLADSHRYYQYVAMCNVSTFGGSGVFAPMRLPGWRQVLAEIGVGTEAIAVADIDLDRLRNGRREESAIEDHEFMDPSALVAGRVEMPI